MGTSSGEYELNRFHIDYTIYAIHVLIKTAMSQKSYRTHYKIQ